MITVLQLLAGIQILHLVYLCNSIRSLAKKSILLQEEIDSYE